VLRGWLARDLPPPLSNAAPWIDSVCLPKEKRVTAEAEPSPRTTQVVSALCRNAGVA